MATAIETQSSTIDEPEGAALDDARALAALALIGAFDAISMVIRSTLQLTLTPDHMRGRVGSVHYMFVGMSNEFGEFESGLMATLIGAIAVPSVLAQQTTGTPGSRHHDD